MFSHTVGTRCTHFWYCFLFMLSLTFSTYFFGFHMLAIMPMQSVSVNNAINRLNSVIWIFGPGVGWLDYSVCSKNILWFWSFYYDTSHSKEYYSEFYFSLFFNPFIQMTKIPNIEKMKFFLLSSWLLLAWTCNIDIYRPRGWLLIFTHYLQYNWPNDVSIWEYCAHNYTACPNRYKHDTFPVQPFYHFTL